MQFDDALVAFAEEQFVRKPRGNSQAARYGIRADNDPVVFLDCIEDMAELLK
jgi:hypothetical protein